MHLHLMAIQSLIFENALDIQSVLYLDTYISPLLSPMPVVPLLTFFIQITYNVSSAKT